MPRLEDLELPSRHLGLVTVGGAPAAGGAVDAIGEARLRHVDLDGMLAAARGARRARRARRACAQRRCRATVRVGVLRDAAFMFYYPENLEALAAAGAELVALSPAARRTAPRRSTALYIGGGFPEVHAAELSANATVPRGAGRRALTRAAGVGGVRRPDVPRAHAGRRTASTYPMAGSLPLAISFTAKPKGHGYVVARVDGANPFLAEGTVLRGHEFHYSQIDDGGDAMRTVLALERGTGIGGGRDGVVHGSVFAAYTHLHALGTPEWAPALIAAAQRGGW